MDIRNGILIRSLSYDDLPDKPGRKPDEAHVWTDKKLKELESRIAAEYKKAADELQEKVDAYFTSFSKRDAEQKTLIDTVVNGKVYTVQDYQQWRLAQIGRGYERRSAKGSVRGFAGYDLCTMGKYKARRRVFTSCICG